MQRSSALGQQPVDVAVEHFTATDMLGAPLAQHQIVFAGQMVVWLGDIRSDLPVAVGRLIEFGLGDVESYDRLIVTWPDGVTEDFGGGEADRVIQLNRGEGTVTSPELSADRTSIQKTM